MDLDTTFYQTSKPQQTTSSRDNNHNSYLMAREWGVPLTWLGDILIAARKELGLSQQEVASLLHIYPSAYSRWETDRFRSASLERVATVAQALNLDARVIVFPSRIPDRKEEATPKA